jgi:hypothetical protein
MVRRFSVATTFVAAVSLSAGLIGPHPRAAQAQQQSPASSLPSDEQLDALAAARNWNAIGTAIKSANDAESLKRAMEWLSTRLMSGGGSFLGFVYAPRLWGYGNALRVDDPARDLRVTAGMIVLYTYELIVIDGAKCADRTAPGSRITQLFAQNSAALAYLTTKPDDVKAKVIEVAIAFEKRTSPLRKDDDLLCRSGMEEMKAGLDAGTQQEVTGQTNRYGRTVAVEALPGNVPRFLPPETYQPIQQRARSEMAAQLRSIIQ